MIRLMTTQHSLIVIPFRYGRIIFKKYRAFNDAENDIQEQTLVIRTLVIDATWTEISEQLTFLQRISTSLSEHKPEYLSLQKEIVLLLQRRLEAATLHLSEDEKKASGNGGEPSSSSRRKAAKHDLVVKPLLEAAILDLQTWQKLFDPPWYLLLRIADSVIDAELTQNWRSEQLSVARDIRESLMKPKKRSPVLLQEKSLTSAKFFDIPHSTLQTIEIPNMGLYILDSADCSVMQDTSTSAEYARHLASRLKQVEENTFHLLRCRGLVRRKDPSTRQYISFDFLFYIPSGCSRPQSLRSILLSQTDFSLGDRISLAEQLATSISFIHILDIVHKNVRPETILVFQDDERPTHLGPLFLLGSRALQTTCDKAQRFDSSARENDIYQHPDRQGSHPEEDYSNMQHDIYSLGVCLLEIGLWESFVDTDQYKDYFVESGSLKDQYTALAKKQLPSKMGEKYMNVVINCLSCMDRSNEDFGNESEFQDSDGILIGVKYIEKVCSIYEQHC